MGLQLQQCPKVSRKPCKKDARLSMVKPGKWTLQWFTGIIIQCAHTIVLLGVGLVFMFLLPRLIGRPVCFLLSALTGSLKKGVNEF